MKYKHLFGPVPSRRLGTSLGIDLVPYKTCSLDCVYCECGATTDLTVERREFVKTEEVLDELKHYLSTRPELDYITFSGAGEPTLHSGIGVITDFIKENYPEYKTCLLTNATLLDDPRVVSELLNIDLIIPSLDAVLEDDFRKINRPSEKLDLNRMISGLTDFSAVYRGILWVEIFVMENLNDSDESLERFSEILNKISPNKIQLNTLDRPGAVDWVKAPGRKTIDRFVEKLLNIAPIEVVGSFQYSDSSSFENLPVEEILTKVENMISRRPCTVKDICFSLSLSEERVHSALEILQGKNICLVSHEERGTFYRLK